MTETGPGILRQQLHAFFKETRQNHIIRRCKIDVVSRCCLKPSTIAECHSPVLVVSQEFDNSMAFPESLNDVDTVVCRSVVNDNDLGGRKRLRQNGIKRL